MTGPPVSRKEGAGFDNVHGQLVGGVVITVLSRLREEGAGSGMGSCMGRGSQRGCRR